MTNIRSILAALLVGVLIILGTSVYLYLTRAEVLYTDSLVGQQYRELSAPTGFLHTDGKTITLGEYIGEKVILLEFMRYGCPNCQRAFPHIVALHEKYKDSGLMIIGIHTPQFPHESVMENVTKAMEAAKITFPVVLDDVYGTWNAYGNSYWPRTLLIDLQGTIVYDHIGGDGYSEIQENIEVLLPR